MMTVVNLDSQGSSNVRQVLDRIFLFSKKDIQI